MDTVQRRLLLAIAASSLLHLWLAQAATEHSARRVTITGGAPLRAALRPPPLHAEAAPHPAPRDMHGPAHNTLDSASPARGATAAPATISPATAAAPVEARAAVPLEGNAALTQPSDPTYYTARSLDVFPKAITALALSAPPGTAKVRATVLIDESGGVTEVRAIEAGSAEIENAARDLLLRTRFTPASKDGRIVKAQVLVSLE